MALSCLSQPVYKVHGTVWSSLLWLENLSYLYVSCPCHITVHHTCHWPYSHLNNNMYHMLMTCKFIVKTVAHLFLWLMWSTPGVFFKNTYELLNPRALKISMLHKNCISQCMGKIFCMEFQREPLKFHTKYLIHTLKDVLLFTGEILRALRFRSSQDFLKCPPVTFRSHKENDINTRVWYRDC